MVGLLVAYAFSGTFTVGSNEVAVRLRFGDYVGGPGNRVLERGTYLAAPFPSNKSSRSTRVPPRSCSTGVLVRVDQG